MGCSRNDGPSFRIKGSGKSSQRNAGCINIKVSVIVEQWRDKGNGEGIGWFFVHLDPFRMPTG